MALGEKYADSDLGVPVQASRASIAQACRSGTGDTNVSNLYPVANMSLWDDANSHEFVQKSPKGVTFLFE